MNDVINVCRYIVTYEESKGRSVSNLRLQKLLYFIQALYLLNYDRVCFSDEIEAWQFGPVVRKAYVEYNFFGGVGIRLFKNYSLEELIPSVDERNLIDGFLDNVSSKSTNTLVEVTHRQDPWVQAYVPDEKNIISADSIQIYFNKVRG